MKNVPVFVSGSSKSSLYISSTTIHPLPVLQGEESTGANSIASANESSGIVVGGDFRKDTLLPAIAYCSIYFLTACVNLLFHHTVTGVCVAYIGKSNWITCGTSGVDISSDGGLNWRLISTESFHVCQKAKKGKTISLPEQKEESPG